MPVSIDVAGMVADPELDAFYVVIVDTEHGVATLSPDGRSIRFNPDTGYFGSASVTIVATDGFSQSAPAVIPVTVSDAPLIHLDVVERAHLVGVGDAFRLTVVGDFADQENVLLPTSFVQFASLSTEIADVALDGVVTAKDFGSTVLIINSGQIQAATVLNVVNADDPYADLNFTGLGAFPEAISLPDVGGVRQLIVTLDQTLDVSSAASGTLYFVSDESVIDVTADGLITTNSGGFATVTIIHAGQEILVPVHVETPHIGPATLGPTGGVVQGTDGSLVQIPPGALINGVNVSITPVGESDVDLSLPDWLDFLGAFDLDVGLNTLQLPASLAVPVPEGTPVGSEVYFYMEGVIPDEFGNDRRLWLEVEVGIVGPDGLARTTSPPFGGPRNSGRYLMAIGQHQAETELTLIHLSASNLAHSLTAVSLVLLETGGSDAVLGSLVNSNLKAINTLALHLPVGEHEVELRAAQTFGPPKVTTINVTVAAGLNEFFQRIELGEIDAQSPLISSLEVVPLTGGVGNVGLRVTGDNFDDGSTYSVSFAMPGSPAVQVPATRVSNTRLEVDSVPSSIILGLASVQVLKNTSGGALESNEVRFVFSNQFAFVTKRDEGQLAFLDVTRINPGGPNPPDALVATVPLGSSNSEPTFVASTSDDLRVYVVLKNAGGIAVVDTLGLRQFDVDPSDPDIDIISLPGVVSPREIVVDPNDEFLYVSDFSARQVFVVDIRPGSSTFHKVVKTITFFETHAPMGLQGMAINSDTRQLFVAAPNRTSAYGPPEGDSTGNIIVVDISPDTQGLPRGTQWQVISVGDYPLGVATTSDPEFMAFTNYADDRQGVGILKRVGAFWQLSHYVDLTLGEVSDSYDVSSARDVVFTPDGSYAFVLGYTVPDPLIASRNHGFTAGNSPYAAGSNVGIIQNPLSTSAKLVAGTTPLPYGYPFDFSISPEGKRLYVPFGGIGVQDGFNSRVTVYDVDQILSVVGATPLETLAITPVDALNSSVVIASAGLDARLWGIELQDTYISVNASGSYGDIISIDLASKLSSQGIPFRANSFESIRFQTGAVASFDNDGRKTGLFYYVPPINVQRQRLGLAPNQLEVVGDFVYQTPDGQRRPGKIVIRVSDGYSTLLNDLQSPVGLSLGTNTNANRPLDVYRIQQRLSYLGFGDAQGQPLIVDGQMGPRTDEAIKLFQAVTRAEGNGDPQANSSGRIDPGDSVARWLSGVSVIAPPRWLELVDPDADPPGQPQYVENGGSFDILPGGDRSGNVPQVERFGTSWAIQIIRDATANTPGIPGLPDITRTQVITGISEGGYTTTFGHVEHRAGLDIDVRVRQGSLVQSSADIDIPSSAPPGEDARGFYMGLLTPSEQVVVRDILAFYDAAGNQFMYAYVGATQSQYTAIRRVLNKILELEGFEGIAIRPAIGHDNHFHVSLKPPTLPLPIVNDDNTARSDSLDAKAAAARSLSAEGETATTLSVTPTELPDLLNGGSLQQRSEATSSAALRQTIDAAIPSQVARTSGEMDIFANSTAPAELLNGDFGVGDPASAGFGWRTSGGAFVAAGQGHLEEDPRFQSGFSQTFVVPDGATALRFTIHDPTLGTSPLSPPDAFEVALLDAATMTSVVDTVSEFGNTDALLNIQHDGKAFFGSQVTVIGVTASGGMVPTGSFDVVIDLTGVSVNGNPVTLYFDLLGFGALDSSVVIDNVQFDGLAEPGILVTPTSGLVTSENGATAHFDIVLSARPTADVKVNLFSTNTKEGTLSTPSVTFTPDNWNVPQTITVTGVDDAKVDGNVAYRIVTAWATSLDSRYHGINPDDVLLTNLDNDGGAPAGILVTPTTGLATSENGGTAEFSVVLTAKPTAYVTFTLHSTDATEGVLSLDRLTFTPDNWDTPQVVTVTGVDDDLVDGDQTYTIVTTWAQSADGHYHGINPADVTLLNQDNDQQPALTVLVGDYNHDGAVDAADYVVWRAGLGRTVPPFTGADGNGNGSVGSEDYSDWRSNFDTSVATNVPLEGSQLTGDFSGDGQVDAADYVLWRKGLGTNVTSLSGADASGNGHVGSEDYQVWRSNFGLATELQAAASPILVGDYNRDGAVDAADFILYRSTLGSVLAPYSGADGNGNGVVDSLDYEIWRNNFGALLNSGGATQQVQQRHGDYNQDGLVDAADYGVYRHAFGSLVAPFSGADGNGDGVVDAGDYDVWRSNVGASLVAKTIFETPTVPGDFNGDQWVDAADYVVWRNDSSTTSVGGRVTNDAIGDALTDIADYLVWRRNFGLELASYESQSAELNDAANSQSVGFVDSWAAARATATEPHIVQISSGGAAAFVDGARHRLYRPEARDVIFEKLAAHARIDGTFDRPIVRPRDVMRRQRQSSEPVASDRDILDLFEHMSDVDLVKDQSDWTWYHRQSVSAEEVADEAFTDGSVLGVRTSSLMEDLAIGKRRLNFQR